MFEDIVAENGTKFLFAAGAVVIGLACLAIVLWIVRSRPSSPFIRGGRNRQPRLAVLDAAAIDTRRRLVLVRRDDVEHLVMIGGPTDIVIESRIVGAKPEAAAAGEPVVAAETGAEKAAAQPETPALPVAAAVQPAAIGEQAHAVRKPEGVSAMSKVLYAPSDEAPARGVQPAAKLQTGSQTGVRPATVPVSREQTSSIQTVSSERRAEAMLDQARQRVLATPRDAQQAAATPVNRPAAAASVAGPTDNAALVSEFEKILEAEMTSPARDAIASTGSGPRAIPVPANTVRIDQQQTATPKSREETEAEMARLLGELSANRKG